MQLQHSNTATLLSYIEELNWIPKWFTTRFFYRSRYSREIDGHQEDQKVEASNEVYNEARPGSISCHTDLHNRVDTNSKSPEARLFCDE